VLDSAAESRRDVVLGEGEAAVGLLGAGVDLLALGDGRLGGRQRLADAGDEYVTESSLVSSLWARREENVPAAYYAPME
jgi:hypothetical protein